MSDEKNQLSDAWGELLRTNGLLVAPRLELDDIEDQIDHFVMQGLQPTFDLFFRQMAARKRVREANLAYVNAMNTYLRIKNSLADE